MIVFSLQVCRFHLPRKGLDHHLNILKFRSLKDACHVLLKIAQWIWRFFFLKSSIYFIVAWKRPLNFKNDHCINIACMSLLSPKERLWQTLNKLQYRLLQHKAYFLIQLNADSLYPYACWFLCLLCLLILMLILIESRSMLIVYWIGDRKLINAYLTTTKKHTKY